MNDWDTYCLDEGERIDDCKTAFEKWQRAYPLHYLATFYMDNEWERQLILELLAAGRRLDDLDCDGSTPWELGQTNGRFMAFLNAMSEEKAIAAAVTNYPSSRAPRRI